MRRFVYIADTVVPALDIRISDGKFRRIRPIYFIRCVVPYDTVDDVYCGYYIIAAMDSPAVFRNHIAGYGAVFNHDRMLVASNENTAAFLNRNSRLFRN